MIWEQVERSCVVSPEWFQDDEDEDEDGDG
jgi:hypothetical protein